MRHERCIPNADDSGSYAAPKRRRPFCGQQRVAMKPFSHALLFVSLFSVAISFPTAYISVPKSSSRDTVESRSSFHRATYSSSFQYMYLPEVFVLSLSSTSHSHKSDLARDTRKNKQKTSRKSKKITVETIDISEQELTLRTIEYRRRKHEWAERYTSQEGLREAFGSNRNRWWGDLDAKTARRLYKSLLFPTALSELIMELGDEIARPEELAPLAYEARRAAKMYARERCRVPSRVGAYLFDGFRQLRKYGRFQPNGASYEQLWIRYYEEHGSNNNTDDEWEFLFGDNDHDDDQNVHDDVADIIDIDDAVTEDEIVKRTCQRILEKSCTTNKALDRFYLKEFDADVTTEEVNNIDCGDTKIDCDLEDNAETEDQIAPGKMRRGKRWRIRKKRQDRDNDVFLENITKTLERDVRRLLEPPPSSLSHSIPFEEGEGFESNHNETLHQRDHYSSNNNWNSDSGREEGTLSSRRMTRQEYHSLKLFAKARKYSQQYHTKGDHPKDSPVMVKKQEPVEDEDE